MRRFATSLTLLLVTVGASAGCGPEEAGGNGPVYVALGDSYTSGPGISPTVDRLCSRSSLNYPSLVAKALKASKFSDRSCAGATTAELEKAQTYRFAHLNDPQLEAVDRHSTLVTVGIGLNNGLISTGLLLGCLEVDGAPTAACEQYLSYPESAVDEQLDAAAGQVRQALETIAHKAPRARIVLVGYPRLVPDEGSCPDRLPVPDAQVARMREAMRYANDAWRKAAQDAGASYVDMYTPSQGHDICSADPWISDARGVAGKANPLHPFGSYEKAVADAVVKLVKSG
ncbi:hypothetical protein ACVW00_003229 [Marmoricola sp. URHA0025 HA25]